MKPLRRLPLILLATLSVLSPPLPPAAHGAELTLAVVDKPSPGELSEAIQQTLLPKAYQLLDGAQPVYEFWFTKAIPLKTKPSADAKALDAIRETTFIGAAAVHADQRDYKDNEVSKGVYTVRFAVQPQDGDHLGTSLHLYYALLIPAQRDATPDSITRYKQMVKASGADTSTGHPAVLSLRPASPNPEGLPKLTEPEADHKCIQFTLRAKEPDSDALIPIAFELVYEGHGKIQ